MSEENKKNEGKEKEFKLEIEPIEFNALGQFIITTSSDFGKLVSECFKVFGDFCGVDYEPEKVINNGGRTIYQEPSFTLAFRHGSFPEETLLGVEPAFSKDAQRSSNAVLRVRGYDNERDFAGKYQVTDDLKSVIKRLLIPNYFNNGKINWGRVCVEKADRDKYNNPVTVTCVQGISVRELAYLIYGRKVDGDEFDYSINQLAPIQPQSIYMYQGESLNYAIQINKISVNNTDELLSYYGINRRGRWIY